MEIPVHPRSPMDVLASLMFYASLESTAQSAVPPSEIDAHRTHLLGQSSRQGQWPHRTTAIDEYGAIYVLREI